MKQYDKKFSTLKKESKYLNVKLNKNMIEDKVKMVGHTCTLSLTFDSLFIDNIDQHYLWPWLSEYEIIE